MRDQAVKYQSRYATWGGRISLQGGSAAAPQVAPLTCVPGYAGIRVEFDGATRIGVVILGLPE